jgi:hypothetical protein
MLLSAKQLRQPFQLAKIVCARRQETENLN